MLVKVRGEVYICAERKGTLNKALQQPAYPMPVVSSFLGSLEEGKIFAKIELAQAFQ